jgi:hypothetical protein
VKVERKEASKYAVTRFQIPGAVTWLLKKNLLEYCILPAHVNLGLIMGAHEIPLSTKDKHPFPVFLS